MPSGGADLLAGSGALCPVPFHCSARVTCWPLVSVLYSPAAMQADGAGQATEKLGTSLVPGGVGVGWMRHRVPFHRSARVCGGKHAGKVQATPAAVQADS